MDFTESHIGLAITDRNRCSHEGYNDRGMVAELIANALLAGGLGRRDKNAPLRDIIEPGMTVLLKPNWVLHCNMGGKGMDCMITNWVFIEEVIKQVVKASPGRIILGDAPIQRTIFAEIASPDWIEHLEWLAQPARLEVTDFRKSLWCGSGWESHVVTGGRKQSDYILFDLGDKSLLEPISTPLGRFRNTCYDPEALAQTHRPGRHQFLLCREFFKADVVLNLPKLKSHRKAGITAALKNLVGINGDKDFLPHHRIGGSTHGGDCYEGKAFFKFVAEQFIDHANRRINSRTHYPLRRASEIFLGINKRLHGEDEIEGGWHGNDTVWRMALDLNRIALYGREDGSILAEPQRRVYCLTDAIIAGEAFGPLAPEPIHLGAVTFAGSTAYADLVNAALMRFDWRKIPIIKHSFDRFEHPLTGSGPEHATIAVNGGRYTINEISAKWGMNCRPAKGWVGHIELEQH